MSTWSDTPVRGSVLRGGAAVAARPARIDSDLRTSAFASAHVIDARLTDPHLQSLVDDAMSAALAVLADATSAFERRQSLALDEVEAAVVELALGVARAVLDRELAVSVDPGAEALARALALAPGAAPAVARLHPDDLAALQQTDASGREVTLVADPAVERGGCVVDSGGRRVDAQLGSALERVAAVLR